jgi:hypothetical protein
MEEQRAKNSKQYFEEGNRSGCFILLNPSTGEAWGEGILDASWGAAQKTGGNLVGRGEHS